MKILTLSLLFSLSAFANFTVPATPNPVNDYANILSADQKEELATDLVTLRTATGIQMGVLIVDSLDGDSIEEASIRTAEKWKLGTAEKDNGLLLLIAVKDRKMRLEVGQGLEGILTDYKSSAVIDNMKQAFKKQRYFNGIKGAISDVNVLLLNANEPVTTPDKKEANTGLILLLLFSSLGAFFFIVYLAAKRKKEEEAAEATRESLLEQVRVIRSSPNHYLNNPPPVYTSSYSSSSSSDATETKTRSSSDSSSSSSNDSDWGGGGGGFSGGGSSGDW